MEEQERHWHGGGDQWSATDRELRLARAKRHWKRAWCVGFLAAPLVLAASQLEHMSWLSVAGLLLWVASLGYLLIMAPLAE